MSNYFQHIKAGLICAIAIYSVVGRAQVKPIAVNPKPFADNAAHWYGIVDKGNMINPRPGKPHYLPTDIKEIGDNILLFQKANGGWPKNYDIFAILTPGQKDSVAKMKTVLNTTFDNGSTYTHIAALAQIYNATHDSRYKDAALSGLNFILISQYKNGGWPQYYPLEKNYSKEITFNDGVFEGVIRLLKNISDDKPEYAFVDAALRTQLKAAYFKGIDCILNTQINDTGKPTAWCQQYNEVTLQPAWARKFEPPSICNGESADVVLFLMSLNNPDKRVIEAVQNATAWFRQSEILHTRVKVVEAPRTTTPFRVSTTDRVVVNDKEAPPIWTRYYELKTHKPIFCNRDSKIVYSLAEVARERRDGYAWYTYAPQKVLDKYPAWQNKWTPNDNVLAK